MPSGDVAGYIADMLAELADMAAVQDDAALEAVIRIAAIQAERSRRTWETQIVWLRQLPEDRCEREPRRDSTS